MSYEHAVFISYSHNHALSPWLRNHIQPTLESLIQLHAGRQHTVFIDDQIATGSRWSDVLCHKVAKSRLLVAFLCADYFQRDWCRREMALMLAREKKYKFGKGGGNCGLVLPFRVGDGAFYPDLAKQIQRDDLSSFVGIAPDTQFGTGEKLHAELNKIAKFIAELLVRVPDYDSSFVKLDCKSLLRKLKAKKVKPQAVPRNTTRKPQPVKSRIKSAKRSVRRSRH